MRTKSAIEDHMKILNRSTNQETYGRRQVCWGKGLSPSKVYLGDTNILVGRQCRDTGIGHIFGKGPFINDVITGGGGGE